MSTDHNIPPLCTQLKRDVEVVLRCAYKAKSRSASVHTLEPSAVKRACSRVKDRLGFPGTLSFHNEVAFPHPESGMPIFKLTISVGGLP